MAQPTTTQGQPKSAPKGWDRLVAQLNSVPDLATLHRGMLDLQCKIVAAEYGVLWMRDNEGKPRAIESWPQKLGEIPAESPILELLNRAAASGLERGASHVLKAELENSESPDLGAHVFVTVLRVKGQVVGVTTVVAETRDLQVLQSTAPLRELGAGLYENFFSRQEAIRHEQDAQSVRKAMAILAVSQEAEGFGGAALNLVNELARQLQCVRVSLGWIKGRGVKLVAMSDTEHLKRHSEDVALLELAMAECLDQQQPVAYPVPGDAEPLLQQAVIHAHRRVTGNQAGRHVVSLPLRHRDEWIGVLTIERADQPFAAPLVQFLQLILDVVAPHLSDRYHSDQFLAIHAWHSTKVAAGYLLGPRHTGWKLGAVAVLAVLGFICFGWWDYKVTAPFVFEAQAKRILSSPFEARLDKVFAEPGDEVKAGTVLAELDVRDLKIQVAESRAKLAEALKQYDKARTEGKTNESQQAQAAADQTTAHLELLQYMVDHAKLTAPIDGVVLSGAWRDKIGGVIKQGDPVFEIAPIDNLIAVLRVSETDINQIDATKALTGHLATKSEPEQKFDFRVERIVPLATPKDGVNAFEVRARCPNPGLWLRPGMEGLAKVDVGDRRILWILTHRISDTLRLWAWQWS